MNLNATFATEDTHGHDTLLPPSTLIDLLQALEENWNIILLQIKTTSNKTCTSLFLKH